jgi:hypothetical protein
MESEDDRRLVAAKVRRRSPERLTPWVSSLWMGPSLACEVLAQSAFRHAGYAMYRNLSLRVDAGGTGSPDWI